MNNAKVSPVNSVNHNQLAKVHHDNIVNMGYWDNPPHVGILLMLIVTEISKLFDEAKLNKPEKLADIALRLYDYCGYHKVDLTTLPDVESAELWDMINCMTCEMEAYRVDMDTKGRHIKQCLAMCYKYAELNEVCLAHELTRKQEMLKLYVKKKI